MLWNRVLFRHTRPMIQLFAAIFASVAMLPAWVTAAESCPALFEQLDRRHGQVEEAFAESPEARRPRLKELESELFAALARCPNDASLFALMGELQIGLGQVPLATVYGRKAVELDPSSWRAQQLLGSSLAMIGRPEEGIAHLERASSLAPQNPGVRLNLASALILRGQYRRALVLCEPLIMSQDKTIAAAAHNIRGQGYAHLGALNAAAREFNAAEKLGFQPRRSLVDLELYKGTIDTGREPAQ